MNARPLKVLVASTGHKEFLSPAQACAAISRGLREADASLDIMTAPMADGGDGLIDAALSALPGRVINVATHDPLYRPRQARMGIAQWQGARTALIESAEACGAALLPLHERQTMVATSFGLGEMMLRAADEGCTRLVIGLGGSIVTDCGLGMAQALGFTFRDQEGNRVAGIANAGLNALNLRRIASIDRIHVDPRLANMEFHVACDVDIPLLGPHGQARTFGPQKYANAFEIEYLEQGLDNVARVIEREYGRDVNVPLAGAAGGIAAGLLGLLGAQLHLGAALVDSLIGLEAQLRDRDIAIIGEGTLDETTLNNKAPYYVGTLAHRLGKPVVAIVGSVGGASPVSGYDFFDALYRGDARARPAVASSASLQTDLERAAREAGAGLRALLATRRSP